jgi:alanine racemase
MIQALSELGAKQTVHIKVDTGMHRVGADPGMVPDLLAQARSLGLEVEGMWTHFAVADEDPEFTRSQIDRFMATVSPHQVPMTHLANTAGALLFPESRQSMTRIGLGLYGLHPCADTRGLVELRPAMRIVTHVSHVQRLEPGSRPSYGRIRPLVGSATVATAPIGYADGFPRRLSRTGVALIGETPFPLAGMVTMDQIVIDVGDAEVAPGDEVVVLGTDGEASFTADDWARALDTISYEVVCGIGPRVPRRYVS